MSNYRFYTLWHAVPKSEAHVLTSTMNRCLLRLSLLILFCVSGYTTFSQCAANLDFESGDFSGWTVLGQSSNASVSCAPFRYNNLYLPMTIDASCFGLHAFDVLESGTVSNCYECSVSNCNASLDFDYRVAYDTRGRAAIPNLLEVTVIDASGNLTTVGSADAEPDRLERRSSLVRMSDIDLSVYECTDIQLCFTTTVPASMTGEVVVAFDNVNLSDDTCPAPELSCINQINLSLGLDCEAEVNPASVLSNSVLDPADYRIVLLDEHNDPLQSNTVDISHLNSTLTYQIFALDETCNENSCWGQIQVEYKFQPVFDGCADLTISCAEIDILPPPTVGGGTSCLAQTFEIALANEVTTEPTDCNSPYVGTVVRTFQATDGNGNTASCEQNIQLERIDFTKL